MNFRIIKGKFFQGISYIAAITTVLILFFIIGKIALEGIPSLSFEFIFTSEADMPGFGGAIGNAIVGTLFLSLGSTLLAAPFGVGTAIYLKRYAADSPFVRAFSFFIDVLAGTPSIVLGIFGLMILVFYMRAYTGGYSLISGIIALAILVLPVIERASEEAIDTVSSDLEEGSYALGATKWDTIRKITLPCALSGIMTGIVLGVGRAAEESAVVILTAGYSQFYPEFKISPNENLLFGMKVYPFQDLVAALPITIYHGFEFPHLVSQSESFGAAFVLIVIVMTINIIARLIVRRRRIG
jgi:phosphate transport system permease protein